MGQQLALATTDLLLVDRCRDGNDAATRELFRQYHKRVHATLYRILGSSRDIDDLMQDAFIQVFKSLPKFRGEARLSTWIDRITVRVAYRYINASKRLPQSEGTIEDIPVKICHQPAQVYSREGIRRLYESLAKLPATLRIAFVLHEVDGRSVAEVAEIVGAAKSATKLRIWRARRALYKLAAADPVLSEFLGGAS